MGEILFFYCLTAFVLCYFFRKFCQDPNVKKQLKEEEKEEAAAAAAEIEMTEQKKNTSKE